MTEAPGRTTEEIGVVAPPMLGMTMVERRDDERDEAYAVAK
jgi:hypothetical protein